MSSKKFLPVEVWNENLPESSQDYLSSNKVALKTCVDVMIQYQYDYKGRSKHFVIVECWNSCSLRHKSIEIRTPKIADFTPYWVCTEYKVIKKNKGIYMKTRAIDL